MRNCQCPKGSCHGPFIGSRCRSGNGVQSLIPPQLRNRAIADHQQRMVIEFNELNDKLDNLTAFFSSPIYAQLPDEDRALLIEQRTHMMEYSNTLMKRIGRFK